jgi:dihydroorotate dehydrogenase
MPDWSYRTVLRPLLFRLPPVVARDLTIGVTGGLGRSPVGRALIDLLGHMRPPEALRAQHLGLTFPSVVGLGCGLDPGARALRAFARFGFGFVEVGPVALRPLAAAGPLERCARREAIVRPEPAASPGLEAVLRALARQPVRGMPVIARLAVAPGSDAERVVAEYCELIDRLAPYVSLFSLAPIEGWDGGAAGWQAVMEAAHRPERRRGLLMCVSPRLGPAGVDRLARAALAAGADGLLVDGTVGTRPGRTEIGRSASKPTLETVARLRQAQGPAVLIAGSGGVHEPEDALRLLEAGADLVQVDSGLVFSGPGLPKRINEAVLYARAGGEAGDASGAAERLVEQSWFWILLLGLGMLLGSTLALGLALTRVLLPYDEQFVGLTWAQLAAVNERLLPFMAHDRATLAGAMIAVGLVYTGFALFGLRAGRHWARVAVLTSALAGFATFFLFLGFGYFDPFHAFVTAILFQLFLFGLHGREAPLRNLAPPVLRDSWRWRLSQWGQLGLIAEAFGFIVAGLTVAWIGVSQVFVAEDLEFLQTAREALVAIDPRLVALVAHDRATFGGMLFVAGLTFLLASLWGFAQGARWLWWTLLAAGLAGYGAAFTIHYLVGYRSVWHLAPAWVGFGLFVVALALCYPYLGGTDRELAVAWQAHRARWSAREPPAG